MHLDFYRRQALSHLFAGLLACLTSVSAAAAGDAELIRDSHFQNGFFLLAPKPGARVVTGQLAGFGDGRPVWDLAQWSSRFPLGLEVKSETGSLVWSNEAKAIRVGRLGSVDADLTLAVDAGREYPQARKSAAEPWVHLLVQQEFTNSPSLAALEALRFRVEARLRRSVLVKPDAYTPAVHAAQFLIYLTVGNRNPNSPGYQECFWFGVPIYDNRERVVSAYEAQDFGDTKLFIFTPSSREFTAGSAHDGQWVTFKRDLLPLIRTGLEHAKAKRFVDRKSELKDFQPLGIFIGWEVPGQFQVDMQLRELGLTAVVAEPTKNRSSSP